MSDAQYYLHWFLLMKRTKYEFEQCTKKVAKPLIKAEFKKFLKKKKKGNE